MASQPEPEVIDEEAKRDAGMLTVGEHLVEARQRLTIAALTIVLTTVTTIRSGQRSGYRCSLLLTLVIPS